MSDFADFEHAYGPPQDCERPQPAELDRYEQNLPDELLTVWRTVGRCSYGDGLLWFTDPTQLDDVVEDWLAAFGLQPVPADAITDVG